MLKFIKTKTSRLFLRSIDKDSYWHVCRLQRFAIFMNFLKKEIKQSLKIIDIGGTPIFWDNMGIANDNRFIIHCFNIKRMNSNYKNILCFLGDAMDLKDVRDKEYDVAFSNSVIEHLCTFENQKKMANEMKRVAKRYFIQTPNFWFPIEPHLRLPFVHYFPPNIRTLIALLYTGSRITDFKRIRYAVDSIRLLTKGELKELLPEGRLSEERLFGIVKSFMIHNFELVKDVDFRGQG